MSDARQSEVNDIRTDIERTRRELGDTAEALAYKANVPARSKEKAAEVLETAKTKAAHVSEQAQQKIDNLPEPAAQKARGLIIAVKKRPGAFVAGAMASLIVLRKVTRRRRKS
ncbi:DUF3618 domain-containing protein [Kibdelosporangium philippinense]|uniref:DUF3618 domain-containing protein n=1 Tax=Kibdelosporangium philippinense TaxID=211113 RepID=A0ABS8ZWA4_9PSEU|nr:DUF3618 domain-containing protein [Kibdelosporangium philippinense]MCE7010871.1 DUF3618 domain-containing protein [Kibdelosporangium philippinense]